MNLLNLILDSQIIRLLVKLGSYLFDKLILALTTYFVAAEKFSIQKFFFWKTSNYADSYWFLYSNKKTLYEARFL